jgi:aspartyl-tRNA(Asn)/glutamyl-tRNA(Gln) amidotransferase subunit B
MLTSGESATEIVARRGLKQVSDSETISEIVRRVLDENPEQVENYKAGKTALLNWFFGQVMSVAEGKANPQVIRTELEQQLKASRKND